MGKAGDVAFAAGILKDCFGRGGDFTVVVEAPEGGDSGGSEVRRVEFKVWSQLLARWSAVFDRMINSEGFVEGQTAQMVITDFSSRAVEIFLRFLYSGVVEGPLETLVEVCSLADKYQVQRLQELCTEAFYVGLNPQNALRLFAAAARFRLADWRRQALEEIWIFAEDVLTECPNISPELLEEILAPGLICMSRPDFRAVLQAWSSGRKRKAGSDEALPWSLQPVIERHLERLNDESARILSRYGPDYGSDMGFLDQNVFKSLFRSYKDMQGSAPFFGYYLQVAFGPKSWNFCSRNPEPLEDYFSNRKPFSLTADSISWMLPYESVYLMGLCFAADMPEEVHCRVFCSQDGLSWHLAADSGKSKIEAETWLPLSRPSYLVKWFKLEVLEGDFHNNLCVQGIRKDDLPA
ncbi:bath-40 [Symbiodinium sp. CCMP2456]|nr:bath-40 [Symbiodinium sp. CCMP2456]